MRGLRWVGALVALAMLMVYRPVAAQESMATKSFTLQPGGKATVSYTAFCLDFGKKFPTAVSAPATTATPKIQAALTYGLSKGYDSSDALALQSAIWELSEAENLPQGGALADEIVAAAATTSVPALEGTSVLDAVQSGKLKLTLGSWSPTGEKVTVGTVEDHFYGSGQLMLENVSSEALTLAMPVGTVFPTPDSESQSMAGYATDVSVNNPQASLPETSAFGAPLWMLALAVSLLGLSVLVRRTGRVA